MPGDYIECAICGDTVPDTGSRLCYECQNERDIRLATQDV